LFNSTPLFLYLSFFAGFIAIIFWAKLDTLSYSCPVIRIFVVFGQFTFIFNGIAIFISCENPTNIDITFSVVDTLYPIPDNDSDILKPFDRPVSALINVFFVPHNNFGPDIDRYLLLNDGVKFFGIIKRFDNESNFSVIALNSSYAFTITVTWDGIKISNFSV
jgi:hypothetical protein